ncbi:hypothetical protein Nmel_005197, partial [Mimus melanotis]
PGVALAQAERPNKPRPSRLCHSHSLGAHGTVAFPGALEQLQGMNGCAGAAPAPQPSTSAPWLLLGNMGASLASSSPLSTQGKGLLVPVPLKHTLPSLFAVPE